MPARSVAALLAAVAFARAAAGDPLVYTTNGYLQGFVQDGVNVFNGIPFAAPPVGDLRFAAPAPAANWTGTKDVSALPPICPQVKLDGDLALSEDEDCLYLVRAVAHRGARLLHCTCAALRCRSTCTRPRAPRTASRCR